MSNGTVDLACGSATNNLERQKQVAFFYNFFVVGTRLLIDKASGIKDYPDLKGKTVVTTAGTTSERMLKEYNEKEKMDMNIISAKDHGEAFLMLQNGRVQAFMMDDVLLAGARAKSAILGVMRTLPNKMANHITSTYVTLFRNVPLLVQLFIWYYVVPNAFPEAYILVVGAVYFVISALSMTPIAMLFDEPTSALASEMINKVLDVMVELTREGMTMMCVTHEMGFAKKVANRVIFMDKGQIIEDCSKDEFFGSPRSERAQLFLSKILNH